MKTRLAAIMVALFTIFGAASAAFAAHTTASVNMRTGPGTGYSVIKTLSAGTDVSIIRCSGSWCKVSAHGRRGWVSSGYISGKSSGRKSYHHYSGSCTKFHRHGSYGHTHRGGCRPHRHRRFGRWHDGNFIYFRFSL